MPKAKVVNEGLVDSWGRRNRLLDDRVCHACGESYRPKKSTAKYCSRKCMWSKNGGKNKKEFSWWINTKGYVEGRIWISGTEQIRVKQHRWIAEGILGRPLKEWEDVHHKDGNKLNNSPENLEVIEHGEHTSHHNLSREYSRGYKLNLTQEQRDQRSLMAIKMRLSEMGRAAIAKATGN